MVADRGVDAATTTTRVVADRAAAPQPATAAEAPATERRRPRHRPPAHRRRRRRRRRRSKVAFVTKFPVEFFTAMEDAAKSYAARTRGSRSVLLLRDAGGRRLPDRPDRGRRGQGLRRDGDHADGHRRDPGARRCGRQGPWWSCSPTTTWTTSRRRPRSRRPTTSRAGSRRRVPQVGAQGGRHDRPDGRRARRACTRRPHPGRQGRARGHRRRGHHRRRRDQVRLGAGRHGGRGPADPRAEPHRDLLGLRRPGDRRCQGRQGPGQAR